MKPISDKRLERESLKKNMKTALKKRRFKDLLFYFIVIFISKLFKWTRLEKLTFKTAEKIKISNIDFYLKNLPKEFNGYRILFISDFHIDNSTKLCDIIIDKIKKLDYDICCLGGDYPFNEMEDTDGCLILMEKIICELRKKSEVYAILGNHDKYFIGEELERYGAKVLLNENAEIAKGNESIFLCGVDDLRYFKSDDLNEALKLESKAGILPASYLKNDDFKILLSHSPEIYKKVKDKNISLCLSGHSHAGQICLPGGIAIRKNMKTPRSLIYGKWFENNMQGYTSSGVGVGGIKLRLNSFSEIAIINLMVDEK